MKQDITLAPLNDDMIPALRDIAVKPFQQVFSGQPGDFLDTDDAAQIHVILRNDAPCGMFRIDPRYHLVHTFAQSNTPGLRSFIIDQDLQGSGIGTTTVTLLPPYMRTHFPRAVALYLTVNERNPAAYRAYTKGGFRDTGTQYLLGAAGPQHVLRMPLV